MTCDVAGRLERVVGAEAAGHLEDPLDGVLAADERLGRALAARPARAGPRRGRRRRSARRPAGGSRRRRRGRPCPRRRRRTSSRARPCAVFIAAPSPVERPHANRQRASSGASGDDLRERDLRHDGVLGEGRGAHEVADRLAVARQARRCRRAGSPCSAARGSRGRGSSSGCGSGRTRGTAARRASRRGRRARRASTPSPTRLDDAGALVAEHGRRVAGRVGARRGVEVGVADAAGDEPHEHLAGRGSASSSSWTSSGAPNSSSTAARISHRA